MRRPLRLRRWFVGQLEDDQAFYCLCHVNIVPIDAEVMCSSYPPILPNLINVAGVGDVEDFDPVVISNVQVFPIAPHTLRFATIIILEMSNELRRILDGDVQNLYSRTMTRKV